VSSTVTEYSSQIDINYPEVGKDNDTQGFRSNFSNIQAALLTASKEITDLQENSFKLTETNDFNYGIIKSAVLQNSSEVARQGITLTTSGYVTIDYTLGSYYKVTATSGFSYELYVINWPATNQYGQIRVEITPTSTSSNTTITVTNGTLLGNKTFPLTYRQTQPIIYEMWSTDNGATIYAIELTTF
jgi:hypothetical protein